MKSVYTIRSIFGRIFHYIYEDGIITNDATGETFPCDGINEFRDFVHKRVSNFGHTIIGIAG